MGNERRIITVRTVNISRYEVDVEEGVPRADEWLAANLYHQFDGSPGRLAEESCTHEIIADLSEAEAALIAKDMPPV